MGIFHQHKWIEKERFYAAPLNVKNLRGGDEERIVKLTQGFTTIRFECAHCPKIKTEEIMGKSTKGLERQSREGEPDPVTFANDVLEDRENERRINEKIGE